jgi:nicotinate-nucleotide--dimethylbenzimidazole phosphoribosyltransferase
MAHALTHAPGPLEREVLALVATVVPTDPAASERAWERLDSLTKPPRSLGRLEEVAVRVATVQDDVRPSASPAAIVLCAGDHGVVAEGVSPWPSEVTQQMVANFAAGGAAINQIAGHVGARLVLADVGVAGDTSGVPGVLQRKVRAGTRNLAVGPAMTREEAAEAFLAGAAIARELTAEGVRVLGTGEMGIGNTTPASALVSVLAGVDPARVVGPGTGLDAAGMAHKAAVVARGIAANEPSAADPFGTLAALGGLELAAMAGVLVGGAAARACVVADGFISSAASLAAVRICPHSAGYLFPSHLSLEPGHRVVLDALGLEPVLALDMRLGEGTGGALAIGVMGAACAMMSGMATFAEAGVSGRDDA